jgi:hypothetical protein
MKLRKAVLSVPKTLSELVTRWKRLSWRNDPDFVFRPGRLDRVKLTQAPAHRDHPQVAPNLPIYKVSLFGTLHS